MRIRARYKNKVAFVGRCCHVWKNVKRLCSCTGEFSSVRYYERTGEKWVRGCTCCALLAGYVKRKLCCSYRLAKIYVIFYSCFLSLSLFLFLLLLSSLTAHHNPSSNFFYSSYIYVQVHSPPKKIREEGKLFFQFWLVEVAITDLVGKLANQTILLKSGEWVVKTCGII